VNKHKTILHLCADTGSDSKPYVDAGYNVIRVGSDIGVENFTPPTDVYGIIANPPCTHFSIARTNAKTPRDLREGMRLVKECLRVIWECQYKEQGSKRTSPLKFWCIENPATGLLKWFLGDPSFTYSHMEYGGNLSKRTALWGYFNHPQRPILFNPLPAYHTIGHKGETTKHTMEERSLCPINFAKAFFYANQ
jgi:hypothetical protein